MENPLRSARFILCLGALLAAVGVGIGALGSHALPGYLQAQGFDEAKVQKRLEQCETAVRYQLYHALAIVGLGLSGLRWRGSCLAAWGMILGIALFSGGIYGIVFAEAPSHGLVPFGGISFILGWLALAGGASRGSPLPSKQAE
jgi:uncharacterized membrane protein YgdD (TMEM256/DUF423 family)